MSRSATVDHRCLYSVVSVLECLAILVIRQMFIGLLQQVVTPKKQRESELDKRYA